MSMLMYQYLSHTHTHTHARTHARTHAQKERKKETKRKTKRRMVTTVDSFGYSSQCSVHFRGKYSASGELSRPVELTILMTSSGADYLNDVQWSWLS